MAINPTRSTTRPMRREIAGRRWRSLGSGRGWTYGDAVGRWYLEPEGRGRWRILGPGATADDVLPSLDAAARRADEIIVAEAAAAYRRRQAR